MYLNAIIQADVYLLKVKSVGRQALLYTALLVCLSIHCHQSKHKGIV